MTTEALYTNTALRAWKLVVAQLDGMFSSMSDDELQREVAPGRNRVFYLMGHLAAVHDRLLPMLGLGERLHPELDDHFVTNPDRVTADRVAPQAVRLAWSQVNARLTEAMAAMRHRSGSRNTARCQMRTLRRSPCEIVSPSCSRERPTPASMRGKSG